MHSVCDVVWTLSFPGSGRYAQRLQPIFPHGPQASSTFQHRVSQAHGQDAWHGHLLRRISYGFQQPSWGLLKLLVAVHGGQRLLLNLGVDNLEAVVHVAGQAIQGTRVGYSEHDQNSP